VLAVAAGVSGVAERAAGTTPVACDPI
jgi:hypothetical protein